MAEISTLGIVGTDGAVPVYDPNARWCWWSINEVFLGQEAAGRYVPKINDYVIDPDTYTTYKVVSLDLVTLVPNLQEIKPGNVDFIFNDRDKLLGVGPGTQSDTYRIYLDTSVIPHSLAVDARLKVAGSMVKYCKIFKGSNLGTTGEVISRVYDASGNFLGNTVTLETVAFNSHDNYAIKTVPVCQTLTQMPDGEVVVAVFYDDDGHVVSKRQLLVENTSFIRQAFAEEKYITGISIECPFLSVTFDNLIEFPLNIPLAALNILGVVHYSDGSFIKLPVDGNKFKIFGLEQYVSTIVGQKIELVLSYTLSKTEAVYGATVGEGKYITKPYSLVTVEPNNAYTVKVFGYPEWIDQYEGYRMRWFLLNLDRNLFKDVTSLVRFSENTGIYDPVGYGYLQRRAITLNLSEVSGAFKSFIHTQLLDILLRGEPQVFETPWEISQESVAERSLYGGGLRADRDYSFKNKFVIHNDLPHLDEWLNQVYYRTYPLMNRLTEIRLPVPTHFEVFYHDKKMRYSIQDWNKVLSIGVEIPIFKNIYIKFLKESASGDMVLSVAAMIVKS